MTSHPTVIEPGQAGRGGGGRVIKMIGVINSRFDSNIRFENESDGRFDSRFDSNKKNDSQVPNNVTDNYT